MRTCLNVVFFIKTCNEGTKIVNSMALLYPSFNLLPTETDAPLYPLSHTAIAQQDSFKTLSIQWTAVKKNKSSFRKKEVTPDSKD